MENKASNWKEINTLRKTGDLDSAEALARSAVRECPNDSFLKGHVALVFYDRLKQIKARFPLQNKVSKPNLPDISAFEVYLRDYARLNVTRPSLAHSLILQTTIRFGRFLPSYCGFLRWSSWSGFEEPEDFLAGFKEGKQYPSLCTNIAREGAAWVFGHSSVSEDDEAFILAFVERAFEKNSMDVYLAWDLAKIFRRRNDPPSAQKYLKTVLRSKPEEFWVWSEAGKIAEIDGDDGLAIACYSRALSSKGLDEFLNPTRIALASILFRCGHEIWASAEVNRAKESYRRNDWHVTSDLSRLNKLGAIIAPETASAFDLRRAYNEFSAKVQVLFFDRVETADGCMVSFDEILERPRYAYGTITGSMMLLGPPHSGEALPEPGTPLSLQIGYTEERARLIEVTPRREGAKWDCVTSMVPSEKVVNTAIRRQVGTLRALPQGFGFVGDTFVGPELINRGFTSGQNVELISIRQLDKKKGIQTWKACYLSAESL